MKEKRHLSINSEDYRESFTVDQMYAQPEKLLALKVSKSVRDRNLAGNYELNSKQIQECAEEAWRTQQCNFAAVEYVLATLPLDSRTRAIIGVYQFGGLRDNETGKRLKRVSFQDMRPAPREIAEKYLGKKITGFHPRDTNPIRYFGKASRKKIQ